MKNVVITSSFGHEIFAVAVANTYGCPVVIVPNKDTEEEFNTESQNILAKMLPFYSNIHTVDFSERDEVREEAWDVIGELKSETLDGSVWVDLASNFGGLTVKLGTRHYKQLEENDNVLFVPQKLVSDGQCGVTAAQQSLDPNVFAFLRDAGVNLVLGQHFHKVNDKEKVLALADDFNMYVPGLTENEDVFGIRGVAHKEYFDMYSQLSGSVGIAGTHTWIMLTVFPEIPQIILYNKNGVEPWESIARAYREEGYDIYCLGYDENTDMVEFSKQIEDLFRKVII